MPVFKNKTQGQYVNVYKDILKNNKLSLRDRGMVVTLLSLPDNWNFTISGLSKIIPDGKSSIRVSLARLEKLGYISREQERVERGKFGGNTIEIHETPISPPSDFRRTDNSTTGKPLTEKPSPENQTQYINNRFNNNKGTNNQSINHQDRNDGMNDVEALRALIAENIKLDQFYEVADNDTSEHEMIREIYDTICDVVCFPRESMTIKGTVYPWQVVKSQFMKLKPMHISNLLGRLIDNRLEIKNMESYLISTLYAESLSGVLKNQSDLHDDYLKYLRGNPYEYIQ
ncbi:MAG: DUF6017 domain-containing protein [Eubacteriales bacterium]|nr:DUF6017 domain-containing protein [Eubacteriales bacterium]